MDENITDDEKIATVVSVPNFGEIKKQKKPRYILVRAKSIVRSVRNAFQFCALTQTWVNGGMYTEEIGDLDKGEFWLAMKLSRGAPNNATIKHLFDIAKIEYRWIDKPPLDKLTQYSGELKNSDGLGHGYNPHQLGFRSPAWASCLKKDWWDDDDD